MYSRNRIYISKEQQEQIKKFRILCAGAGLGSVISECALRLGFESLKILDYDLVEQSNLNRQNYVRSDIGMLKTEALFKRLSSINPYIDPICQPACLTANNLSQYIFDFDLAINTLDFNSSVPFAFDEYCITQGKMVLHPFNLGWGSAVIVFSHKSPSLKSVVGDSRHPEVEIVKYFIKSMQANHDIDWLQSALHEYIQESGELSPPQLSVGSWLAAGLCTEIMFKIATNQQVKIFPEFYFVKPEFPACSVDVHKVEK